MRLATNEKKKKTSGRAFNKKKNERSAYDRRNQADGAGVARRQYVSVNVNSVTNIEHPAWCGRGARVSCVTVLRTDFELQGVFHSATEV